MVLHSLVARPVRGEDLLSVLRVDLDPGCVESTMFRPPDVRKTTGGEGPPRSGMGSYQHPIPAQVVNEDHNPPSRYHRRPSVGTPDGRERWELHIYKVISTYHQFISESVEDEDGTEGCVLLPDMGSFYRT